MCYQSGIGVAVDHKQALQMFQKASDSLCTHTAKPATTNHGYNCPRATFEIAVCYENGLGVQRDSDKAMKLFKRAAELLNTDAMCVVGNQLVLSGKFSQGKELFVKAAELGNLSAVLGS